MFSTVSHADELAILTGGTSGVYYPVGVKLQEVLERELPEHTFTVLSTQATVENLNLIQRGSGILALAQGDVLSDAWEGNPEAGFPSSRTKIRLIGAAYPNFIHLLAHEDAGIASLGDLVGKRVSVGAGPQRKRTQRAGPARRRRPELRRPSSGRVPALWESVELFVKGELDAIIISAGLGVAAVTEASERVPVRIVPIERKLVEENAKMFSPIAIPAGSYPGQTAEVPTAALDNFFVTTSDASDDLVYRVTKAIFDNLDIVGTAHPAVAVIALDRALALRPIDVHPGALRYFEEKGVAQ